VITTEAVRAWCLVSGEWVEREDPVMAVCDPYGGDVRAAMGSLGYEIWCQVGVEDLPAVPISLAVYSREAPPHQFLLQLEGNAGRPAQPSTERGRRGVDPGLTPAGHAATGG
jgi:hypothetical protein